MKISVKILFLSSVILMSLVDCTGPETGSQSNPRPNIILFYVDDLGYGDISSYGATAVRTPNVDRLASGGIRFTDGHCSAATCTPSRYTLLTGNYAFRNNAAILPGDAPLLIDTAAQTLPKMLKSAGYRTAVVGKWHLGLGYGEIDWNKKITPGANEVGFDYSFLIPATGDRVPTVFVENGAVVNLNPDDPIAVSYSERIDNASIGQEVPDQLKQKADPQHSQTVVNGISRIGYMTGGEQARWVDEEIPFVLNDKAREFISEGDEPFFLYYAFHDIHVPRVPNERFKGATGMGPRGDAIVQMDWAVGDIINALEDKGLLENTLVIFTSDNGPVLDDGYFDQAVELAGEHDPAGGYSGGKYSAYEAGTRVPTIVYWKGEITPAVSDALVSQTDLLASLAALTGVRVDETVVDSQDQLSAWLGKDKIGRKTMLEESFTISYRQGDWKYIRPFEGTTPDWLANKDVQTGLSDKPQLYNLKKDSLEQHNLTKDLPEKVREMDALITSIVNKVQK